MNFKKWVESIQTAGYNGARTVIGFEYRNCHQTLDAYLLFTIWMGQIQSKLNYRLVTYKLATLHNLQIW